MEGFELPEGYEIINGELVKKKESFLEKLRKWKAKADEIKMKTKRFIGGAGQIANMLFGGLMGPKTAAYSEGIDEDMKKKAEINKEALTRWQLLTSMLQRSLNGPGSRTRAGLRRREARVPPLTDADGQWMEWGTQWDLNHSPYWYFDQLVDNSPQNKNRWQDSYRERRRRPEWLTDNLGLQGSEYSNSTQNDDQSMLSRLMEGHDIEYYMNRFMEGSKDQRRQWLDMLTNPDFSQEINKESSLASFLIKRAALGDTASNEEALFLGEPAGGNYGNLREIRDYERELAQLTGDPWAANDAQDAINPLRKALQMYAPKDYVRLQGLMDGFYYALGKDNFAKLFYRNPNVGSEDPKWGPLEHFYAKTSSMMGLDDWLESGEYRRADDILEKILLNKLGDGNGMKKKGGVEMSELLDKIAAIMGKHENQVNAADALLGFKHGPKWTKTHNRGRRVRATMPLGSSPEDGYKQFLTQLNLYNARRREKVRQMKADNKNAPIMKVSELNDRLMKLAAAMIIYDENMRKEAGLLSPLQDQLFRISVIAEAARRWPREFRDLVIPGPDRYHPIVHPLGIKERIALRTYPREQQRRVARWVRALSPYIPRRSKR